MAHARDTSRSRRLAPREEPRSKRRARPFAITPGRGLGSTTSPGLANSLALKTPAMANDFRLWSGLLLGLAAAGCSSPPSSGNDAGPDAGNDGGVCVPFDGGTEPQVTLTAGPFDGGLPLSAYSAAFATAYCQWYSRCNPLAQYVLADCVANIAGRGGWSPNFNGSQDPKRELSFIPAFLDGVDAGRIRYDPAAALACLNQLQAAQCLSPVFYAGPETGCAPYWTGTVATGGACENDRDCSAGLCVNADGGCPGACVALIDQPGASATFIGQCDASAGLYDTSVQNGPGICDPAPDAGMVHVFCLTDGNCPSGEQCALTGSCVSQSTDPTLCPPSCPTSAQCFAVTEPLSPNLDSFDGLCAPNVQDGGACNVGAVLFSINNSNPFQAIWLSGACEPGLVCRGGTATGNLGTCQPTAEVGQPCTAGVQFTGCALGLACTCGVCEIPPGPNASCLADTFGACRPDQAVCSSAKCTALPTSGQPCATSDGVCAQGLFCENAGVCTSPSHCSGETQ